MATPPDFDSPVPEWPVLDRYLAGEARPDERAAVERWVASSPEAARLVRAIRTPVDPARLPAADEFVARLTRAEPKLEAIGQARSLPRGRGGSALGTRTVRWWASCAVAVLVIVVFNMRGPRQPTAFPGRTYATRVGQQAVVTLDDGTRVTLAPRTTVRLVAFGKSERTVALDGEAFFDVRRPGGAPFVVRAGQVNTRVLGTSFVVRHYADERDVRVAVRTGKVSVHSPYPGRPGVVLTTGWTGRVSDSGAVTSAARDTEQLASWVDGKLVFRDAPVAEVFATLTRWYGYRFRVTDSALARQILTVGVSTRSAASALSTLGVVLDVDMTFQGDVVTLTPRRRRAPNRSAPSELHPQTNEVGR